MSVKHAIRSIPGAAAPEENPLPHFRDRNPHKRFVSDGTLLPEELERLGENTGFRVLPYTMQSTYTKERQIRDYETLVLENEHLRAEFLPQYGGRLYSLFDRDKNRELLFKNPIFQPANLAIRDAWFSGGIEWNIAQTGHSYTTCDDVYFARMKTPEGEEFLRMYDYVRTTGLFWQVDFHLPKHARALYIHVRILNHRAEAVPLYWWTNTAIPEERRVRVFSCTGEVIYINPNTLQKEGDVHAYAHGRLPELASMPGVDVTYPQNSDYTNEFFFQNGPDVRCPWEAAAYDDGFLFLERSTQPLRTRKMFCWGNHPGGRNWTDHLSEPGKGAYVEIQAGIAPTQVHGMTLAPGETVEFTQAFSSAAADTALTHSPDWYAGRMEAERAVSETIPAEELEMLDARFTAHALLPCGELLHLGRGWGFLEGARRAAEGEPPLPAGMSFPREAADEEVLRWLALLSGGTLPPLAPGELPRSWMTDPNWRKILERAVEHAPWNTALRVHLGALLYENGAFEAAEVQWRLAGDCAIAKRNLSEAAARRGDLLLALAEMERAFTLQSGREMSREYLALLNQAGQFEKAWQVYLGLSAEAAQDERVMITAAAAALEVGAEDFLQKVFAYPFAVIREGENQMVDLWFRHVAAQEAKRTGRSDLDNLERELRATTRPPRNIDFRLTKV